MEAGLRESVVSDRVVVYTLGGDALRSSFGANCTAVIGDERVLLVDPMIAPAQAREVERAVRRRTSKPIEWIVVTHHHTDHALGAGEFARRGIAVVAHEACIRDMGLHHPGLVDARRRDPALASLFADAHPYAPSVAFDSEVALDLGGFTALVRHLGKGHTEGDAVVLVPDERVGILGDLASAGYHFNYEDADPIGARSCLTRFSDVDARTYIPGHGPTGDASLLDAQVDYHAALAAIVRGAQGEDAVRKIRARFPDYLLPIVVPEAVRRLSAAPGT